jgi:16S rRNA (guanine527-N7)-methyltransferase
VTSNWLPRVLEESRARGFLGPGDIESQITHSEGFALCWEALSPTPPRSFLDLGSGGGLPGLVLLERWRCYGVFLDSMKKRTSFLREVLSSPVAPANSLVLTGRAEELARDADFEGSFDLVTARSFGPPAVVAECSARFLRIGGVLVVSEPPDDDHSRWHNKTLYKLGFKNEGRVRHGAAFQVLTKERPTPREFPRGVGVPGKKPLF